MALSLATASQLKPDIRLAQAVSQFEADLSDMQKKTFRSYRSQSLSSPPEPGDVMRLTAEIDRGVSAKVGSRCVGPRFTNFLQVVQQFAALGDVVVGGSQNLIACGVWSVVRISLLAIMTSATYLDKLSNLFMNVGRSAPRYQSMALLYPRSKNLQSYLSEYFIVVVRLCHQLLKFTQMSIIKQVASTLSDSFIKSSQSDLDHWANAIKEEMSLLTAKKIKEEAQETSRFRALSSKFSKSASHQQKLVMNLRVLNLCSRYDFETTWKQTRKVGNTTLFQRATEYLEWKDRTDSCALVYTGKLGSGKSVLLANIVDDLHIHVQNRHSTVAYFFCRHDIPESLKARTVFGSFARQLLRTIPDLTMVAGLCDETVPAMDDDQITTLLRRALPLEHKAYFVLDGLDECEMEERLVLTRLLQDLQKTIALSLCISYRVEPNSALGLNSVLFGDATIVSIPDDNPDIEAFIDAELESCLENRALVIGEPTLILEIRDALMQGSQGMFLWVVLQIRSLCAMKSDQGIRDALADLPKDLPETFHRILHRSEGSSVSYQRRILHLVFVAHRPLTTEELREALSVAPGDPIWNSSGLLNDVYSTLGCCGSLLTVDEEESTVRFVHHSVKQFLLNSPEHCTTTTFTVENAQRTMADIIVTYLSYGVFDTQLSTIKVPQIPTGSAPSRIIRSALGSSSLSQSLALTLLKSRKRPDFDIGSTLAKAQQSFWPQAVTQFHFYSYAKACWQRHILYVSGQIRAIRDLLLKLSEHDALKWEVLDHECWPAVAWAVTNGNETIIKHLIDSNKIVPSIRDPESLTLLAWSAREGHEALVRLLLYLDDVDVNAKMDIVPNSTPLILAAKRGHEAVVRLLTGCQGVEVNATDIGSRTALTWAAQGGHGTVAKLLLDQPDILPDFRDFQNLTPLSYAARNGHETVAKLLLDRADVDPNIKYLGSMTPLLWAVQYGHEAVVKALLNRNDTDLNSKDSDGRTPLALAVLYGHEAFVKLLLDRADVDPNIKDLGSITPLLRAVQNRHEAVVKALLIRNDTDVNSKDSGGRTPLAYAVRYKNEALVKLLLDHHDVDPNSDDEFGMSPLSWAVAIGDEAIVELLLNRDKTDPNWEDRSGRTSLSHACEHGKQIVVKLLLDQDGIEAEAADIHGVTPLSYAEREGHKEVVKLLRRHIDPPLLRPTSKSAEAINRLAPLDLDADSTTKYESEPEMEMPIYVRRTSPVYFRRRLPKPRRAAHAHT